ncbi:hypothetical protein [Croceibacterium aestuarii]|uniref:hypothetical protein n=1 Tax=Croceibacterium aestuarii TaxID=3064139 RepID=UPI00272DE978|nr:hypothetical protein [Croceibacterium sp. D39]
MQFVACKFRPEDSRSYTYEWEGEPLAIGDTVKVPDRSGDGWKRVEVVSISDEAPPFACKPVLGKLEPETETETEGVAEPERERDALDDADDALLQSFLEDK